jgi:plasmid replication initiation protein
MGSLIIEKKTKYVKKHNAAIRSYSEMTLLEKKLSNVLLYNAYYNLNNKDFHEISISRLLSLLSIKTNDYAKIKNAIKNLMATIIEWNVIDSTQSSKKEESNETLFNSNENWKACTLLSSVHIKGTMVKYEYSKSLRELFYEPSLYSKINLAVQNKFKSIYTFSLYENCLSYLRCGSTGWLNMESFRKLMGIKKHEYNIFRDLNKRVLKPALLEINKLSDIIVKHEIKKIGRSPAQIRFLINKTVSEKKNENTENEGADLISKMMEYGVPKAQALQLVKQYGQNYILSKVNLIEKSKAKIQNTAAYLKAAIREDYKENISKSLAEKESGLESYLKEREAEKNKEKLEKAYQIHLETIYKKWLADLNSNEKEYLIYEMKKFFESSGQYIPSVWKMAKLELNLQDYFNDLNVIKSVKIFVSTIKDNSKFSIMLPKTRSLEEFALMPQTL